MQLEEVLINDRLRFQRYPKNFALQLFIILQLLTREICYFPKRVVYFSTVSIVFPVYKQNFTAQ